MTVLHNMAPLLSRLFRTRKRERVCRNTTSNSCEFLQEANKWRGPQFDSRSQVRVLVSRECDYWGRKVLYDSRSVQKLNASSAGISKTSATCNSAGQKPFHYQGYREVSENGDVYQYLKPCPDIKMLGEMIFGSVAMAYHGTMMKVHTIRSPPQLMISLVYPSVQEWSKKGCRNGQEKTHLQNSTSEIFISQSMGKQESQVAHSVPVDVPSRMSNGHKKQFENSFATTSGSLHSVNSNSSLLSCMASMESVGSHVSCNSYNSLHRRWLRNLHTSMDFGIRQSPEDSVNSTGASGETMRSSGQRRIKVGLCAIITLNEQNKDDEKFIQDFFFSHITLIEGHVNHLKDAVARAFLNRKNFVHIIHEGVEKLRNALQDLLTAPRFVSPAWLNMISPHVDHQEESAKFMREFAHVLQEFDTKQCNFFVSTLLSSILMYHLSWVPTIIPPDVLSEHNYQKRRSAPWLESLAKSHPYNPLWMQLSDLFGSVSFPNKVVKIVVAGHCADILLHMLYIVSYFVRCSDIYERNQERELVPFKLEDNLVEPEKECVSSHCGSTHCHYVSSKMNLCGANSDSYCDNSCPKYCSCTLCKHGSKALKSDQNDYRDTGGGQYQHVCNPNSKGPQNHLKPCTTCYSVNKVPDRNNPCNIDQWSCSTKPNHDAKEVIFTLGSSPLFPNGCCHCHNKVCVGDTGDNFLTLQQKQTRTSRSNGDEGNDSLGYGSIDELPENSKVEAFTVTNDVTSKVKHVLGSPVSVTPSDSDDIVVKPNVNCTESEGFCVNRVHRNSIDTSKLYMQEYSHLRFEHSKHIREGYTKSSDGNQCSEEARTTSDASKLTTVSSDCFDAPEEGYRSMEDQLDTEVEEEHARNDFGNREARGFGRKMCGSLPGTIELTFPRTRTFDFAPRSLNSCEGFSWSLLAGLSDHYMSDFCIQGVLGSVDEAVIKDDLRASLQTPILGEPLSEVMAIVADTDHWRVQLLSSSDSCQSSVPQVMAPSVSALCESVFQMYSLKMAPEFCLMHLEDKLQEVYLESKLLARCLYEEKSLTPEKAASWLGLSPSDLPLLLSVATTHTPRLEGYAVDHP